MPTLSLCVPCYNEEDIARLTVEGLASAFGNAGVDVELVVVDNGSTDATSAVIDRMIADGLPVKKCTVEHNIGYGLGALTGLRAGSGDYLGVIPADGQVDADDVVKLFQVMAGAKSPLLAKVRRRFRLDGLKRKVVSTLFNGLMNFLWGGLGSIDINGSPKMFPREYLAKMDLHSTDWFLDSEMLIRAKQLGLGVVELNVFAQMRVEGTSNVNTTTIAEFLSNILRWRFRPPEFAIEEPAPNPTLPAGDG